MAGYGEDLAFIHDDGFVTYCPSAATGLLAMVGYAGVKREDRLKRILSAADERR
jgi:hypothetical protein